MPSSRLSSVRGAPYRSLSLRGHRRTMSKGELDIRLEGGLELVDAERARMAALGALAVRRWAHRGAEVKAQLEERRAGLARVVRVLERAARIPGGDEVIARFRGDEARLLARVRRAVRGTPSGATLEQALAHWQGCADCVAEAGPSLVLCAGERVPQRWPWLLTLGVAAGLATAVAPFWPFGLAAGAPLVLLAAALWARGRVRQARWGLLPDQFRVHRGAETIPVPLQTLMSDGALRVEGAAVHLETPWRLRLEAADEQEALRVDRKSVV